MSHLCYKFKSSSENEQRVIKYERTSNSAATYTIESDQYNDVVLPTASALIKTKKGRKPVRIFKDIGSQTSFVKADLLKLVNYETIRETNIHVSGINSKKTYKSKIVKFPINVLGQGTQYIKAACLDNISTEFETPGLCKLADRFKQKGYKLADDFTSDKVSDISILLGSDHSHLFPFTQINFKACKDNNESAIYQTPSGVMLSGSIADYNLNFDKLPNCTKNSK